MRELVAGSEARYRLGQLRDALGFAGLEASALAHHIRLALRASDKTIRTAYRKAVAAERKRRIGA